MEINSDIAQLRGEIKDLCLKISDDRKEMFTMLDKMKDELGNRITNKCFYWALGVVITFFLFIFGTFFVDISRSQTDIQQKVVELQIASAKISSTLAERYNIRKTIER